MSGKFFQPWNFVNPLVLKTEDGMRGHENLILDKLIADNALPPKGDIAEPH